MHTSSTKQTQKVIVLYFHLFVYVYMHTNVYAHTHISVITRKGVMNLRRGMGEGEMM